MAGVFALAGSRVLPAFGYALVIRVALDLATTGHTFAVGCCTGADAALLSAVPGIIPPSLVRCLAAFGPNGIGSGPASALAEISAFSGAGGSVQWWAGGSGALRCRLAARTRAVVSAADAGLVVFFSSPGSRGSLLACRCALARGLPVVAYPLGFSVAQLPVLGSGSWVKNNCHGGFSWRSNQAKIF